MKKTRDPFWAANLKQFGSAWTLANDTTTTLQETEFDN